MDIVIAAAEVRAATTGVDTKSTRNPAKLTLNTMQKVIEKLPNCKTPQSNSITPETKVNNTAPVWWL